MEHGKRASRSVLTEKLVKQPRKHSFLKAVELAQLANNQNKLGLLSFSQEPFLFRANPSFGFPASDIQDIYEHTNGKYEFIVNFMGLYGPSSPLPDYFTQSIIDEQVEVEALELTTFYLHTLKEILAYQEHRLDMVIVRKRTPTDLKKVRSNSVKKIVLSQTQINQLQNNEPIKDVLKAEDYDLLLSKRAFAEIHHLPSANQRDFLDLFNHRLVTLYLEASRKYHPYQTFNLPQDYYFQMLLDFIGAPSGLDRESTAIQWHKLVRYAGLVSLKQGSSETISKVVAGYFELSTKQVFIEEYILREVQISEDQLNRLGKANIVLGDSFVCGAKVQDRNSKFRLHLSELDVATFNTFLPIQTSISYKSKYPELRALLDFLKSPEQLADICLSLDRHHQLPMKLSQDAPAVLGYSCWLNPSQTQSRHVVI